MISDSFHKCGKTIHLCMQAHKFTSLHNFLRGKFTTIEKTICIRF